jgi:DNA primase
MPKYFPRHLLYRLRNEIPLERVIADHLNWPCKRRDHPSGGARRFCFVCPRCGESQSAVNPRTNLGRCFRCEENFNAIDFVMLATGRDFVAAVEFLTDFLPAQPSALPTSPGG